MNALYGLMLSLHGLVRGNDMELGWDADTGGQVLLYVEALMRALARQRQVGKGQSPDASGRRSGVSPDYARPETGRSVVRHTQLARGRWYAGCIRAL